MQPAPTTPRADPQRNLQRPLTFIRRPKRQRRAQPASCNAGRSQMTYLCCRCDNPRRARLVAIITDPNLV
jgi:hypothetical protein